MKKKLLAGTIAASLLMQVAAVIPVSAEMLEVRTYTYDNYQVTCETTNSWGNTQVISVTLFNTGDSVIEDWMLYFDPNGQVDNTWDAQQEVTSAGTTYFKNSGYNADIAPDESVSFTYVVQDCDEFPEFFVLCQTRTEKESGYEVDLIVRESWGDPFNGEIIITNTTDKPIEAWELTFDTNFTITEITNSWAAVVTELEPYSYLLKGTYNSTIAANSSVSLGFTGVKNGDPQISEISLTEVIADEELIETVVDCFTNCDDFDSDGDGLPDYIELKIGTDPFSCDTDGDGLSDGDEVKVYGTNPLNADTDMDGLEDGDEGYYGTFYLEYGIYFDPFNPDTDGNGILDGDESISQTVEKVVSVDDGSITGVTINSDINNNLESHLQVYSAAVSDPLAAEAVGLIGEPIAISFSDDASFEGEADVTLQLDSQIFDEVDAENLLLLWHDTESDQLYELETYYDNANYTVQASVPNICSNLLLVDADAWHSVYKSSVVFDSSVYQLMNDTGLTWAESKKYCEDLGGHLVTISSEEEQSYLLGLMTQYGTNYTYWLGYRYVDEYEGFESHWESINGEGMPYTNWAPGEPNALYNEAVAHMYNIVPGIALGLGAKRGQWNDTLDEQDFNLEYSYRNSGIICEYDSTIDLDGDGIPDVIEVAGMVTKNGEVIYTDPDNPDTDGDGLLDGEEMIMECKVDKRIAYLNPGQEYLFDDPTDYTVMDNGKLKGEISFVYFEYNSDPTIPDIADSSELTISDVTVIPDIKEGKAVSISGLITSNYDITSVTVDVYSAESGEVYTSASAAPNKTAYNISALDNDILFNKIPGGNTCCFRVIAEDSSGNVKILVNQSFTVSASSTLKIENVTTIPDIKQGTAVPISGKITSEYNITSVIVGVYSTENGNVAYTSKEATPNAKSFNISAIDNFIEFGKVLGEPEGATRYFRVVAADESGNVKTLVNQAFTVTSNAEPASDIQKILNNIEDSTYIRQNFGTEKVESCVATAKVMLEAGYEPAFVAGMLGNVCCEGNVGQFEYYNSSQDYMQYMQKNYSYSSNYSGKYIYNVNLNTVYTILSTLKQNSGDTWRINGSRVGFGLGSIQWTFGRTYNLVTTYRDVNHGGNTITKDQVIEAEGLMILRELSGYYSDYNYSYVYNNWKSAQTNLSSSNAASNAASDLCRKYEVPGDTGNQATNRARHAQSIYNEMVS